MNEALLLDLYRNPTHFVQTKRWTYKGVAVNSHCGDEISLHLHIHDNTIKKATFQGNACSLCMASAELLCRTIQGISASKIASVTVNTAFERFAVDSQHKRVQCFTLPYTALDSVIKQLDAEKQQ
jgi:NifU-like protein involved in Fe-S cluster formation